jgi:bifunctional NMN adenylyltransferase/nudix hydrolase
LRNLYLGGQDNAGVTIQLRASLPEPVLDYLEVFRKGPHYQGLARECHFIRTYRQQFDGLTYPPTFVTVDAAVVQSGHILLVQRGAEPGKGLWALPGGFVDTTERIATAVLRELYEETRIKCPEPVLRGAIRDTQVFDHPERSLRGRTITHAYLIELAPHGDSLYSVRAGSDAGKARWFPIASVLAMGEQMFDDHLDIVRYFLGQI